MQREEAAVSDVTGRLWEMVEPYVADEGIELDDLEVRGAGPGTIVRITLDGEPPLGTDRIARLSRGLSRLIDAADPIPSSYTLEVSTPGLERALRRRRHYEKSVGREVRVKTRAPVDGDTTHRGVLEDAGAEEFVLDVDGERRRIAYSDVARARTVFTWEKSAKPGTRR